MVEDVRAARVVYATNPEARSTDPWAIASLVAAVIPTLSVFGIVFGHVAHHRIRRSGDKGWGLATAGLAIGYTVLVVTIAAIVAVWVLVWSSDDAAGRGAAPVTADPGATAFTLATTEGHLPDAVVEAAADYVQRRLAGAGFAAKAVARDGGIEVAFDSPPPQAALDLLTQESDVAFRPVLVVGDPAPSQPSTIETTDKAVPDSPSDVEYYLTQEVATAFTSADCRDPDDVSDSPPDGALVACATDGGAKYLLGPVEVLGDTIAALTAGPAETGSGAVLNEVLLTLKLDSAGTAAFSDATARLSSLPPPTDELAIVLDGRVISAPSVNDVIPNGELVLSVGTETDKAYELAGALGYGRTHDWHLIATA